MPAAGHHADPSLDGQRGRSTPSTGPRHWQVFYDTLDQFPTTGPIPAPPQQAAVETALIKNVTAAVTGNSKQRRLSDAATRPRTGAEEVTP